ncbi:unnamed protein product [Paramecium primaurelia]|uniref:Uncharacterized protein n=1 Tax=Paramecium primaurelia TaxID=5886 RepID=A0A8S1JPC4_PARPR|nr:unnamed protein product [Paramecium primaurelia]
MSLTKPIKEYKLILLQNSLYKKKFDYKNKDKFLKILRISISDENILKITNFEIDNLNTLEIPAESSITIHITLQASKNSNVYMKFIRYDTDQIEEELVFKIELKQ